MNTLFKITLTAAAMAIAAQASAQITFYEHDNFQGRSFTTARPVASFDSYRFNDLASSVVVAGNGWEFCEDARFGGHCVTLRPGRYASLGAMGLNDRVSSAREVDRNDRIDEHSYAAPVEAGDYSRRGTERLYSANVTSVHAVMGSPEQRCWVEREQVVQERGQANVPGAIAGALLGGIIGHQVGGRRGNDLATAGGAVAGAAIGANAGRNNSGRQIVIQDVQRCENVPGQSRPEYWDVSYDFEGQEHRVQMTNPPGPTVTVNERGEPRM